MKIKTPKQIEDWSFSVNSNNKTLNNSNENNTLIDEENEEEICLNNKYKLINNNNKIEEEIINYLEVDKQLKNLNNSGLFKNIQFLFLFLFIVGICFSNYFIFYKKIEKLEIGNKNVTIIKSQMSKEMETEAKDCAILGVMMYNNNNAEIANYIRDKFDRKYGGYWCCIVGEVKYQASCYHKPNHYIIFDLDQLRIILFKTP